ncbi:MAG: glycosyl transferase [Verrucomicrobia bacterium GWC2_42_7]|nr:MAG: glycosyl transferase [Verrucomicrobia bacterium GWC2_42_7]
MELSVVVPVYNERNTIETVIARIMKQSAVPIHEIIIVDDGSTDGTREILRKIDNPKCKIFFHSKNQGKGAALRTGFHHITGEIAIVQDADLEYDPEEYGKLMLPIEQGKADVVFGSRFKGEGPHRVVFFWHMVGNWGITLFSNMLTNLNLTDVETCFKMFRTDILKEITLEQDHFGFEPEFTAKVAHLGCRIYEVGISYAGRTYKEGKKLRWTEGFPAVWAIIKYNLFRSY